MGPIRTRVNPVTRTCTLVVFIPFASPEILPTNDHMQNVRALECWTLRSGIHDWRLATEGMKPAISPFSSISFWGSFDPWTLHEVDYYAAQFFTDLLLDCITDSSMDYLKKFTAAYLRDDIRWSWPEAQPALRAAFRVLLQAGTYSGTEVEIRDTPPGDAALIPYVTADRDHLGFAGLTGLMRSLLVAINVSAPTLRNNKNTYSMSWPTWLNLWAQESAPPLIYHVLPEDT